MQPIPVADYACHTGENPLWNPSDGKVYWVDIPAGRLFRYDPVSGEHEQVLQDRPIGGFTLQADGSLLLFMDRGTVAVLDTVRGETVRMIIEEIPDETETRFNDVIADPEGRVFCGTMPAPGRLGRLYRLERDGSYEVVLEGVGTANGMGFTPDLSTFFFTDTPTHRIDAFDYDARTGAITNRRPFIEKVAGEGGPDGMTVDAQGQIWTAKWGGSAVIGYDPNGEFLQRIEIPTVQKVSSVVFGGEGLRSMYMTTAGGHQKDQDGADAGALFRLDGMGPGKAEFVSRIGL